MRIFCGIVVLFICFLSVNSEAVQTHSRPRYEGEVPLEVFVIPHSHDDVGWIVTMNQYFESEVQFIYDTVVDKLLQSPERRFSIVEVGFLKLWWEQATPEEQANLKELHSNGQVEFLIGGIVMNDEAAASYEAIINQMQEGHKFLLENFGATPRIGWQVDPFGSSRGTPTLSAWDCFDAMITARINYLWKDNLQNNQSLEFVWHGTNNLGQETDLFTHIMDQYSYCVPSPFSYSDAWNIYDPPNPNPPINEDNIARQADILVGNFVERAAWFATNNLLWPFGCDFNYQNADTMFKSMDKLIKYVNDHSDVYNIHARYAHVQDYFTAVHNTNSVWPEYSGDFFPYNDNDVSFWTGYFSSRNALKLTSRIADGVLRSADLTSVLSGSLGLPFNQTEAYRNIDNLRLQSAISQHHDGISGTARPNVIKDYVLRLENGIEGTLNQTVENIQTLTTLKSTPSLNVNASFVNEILLGNNNQSLAVVVYNSLPYTRNEFISLVIPSGLNVSVTDSFGNVVPSQIDPVLVDSEVETLYIQTSVAGLGFSTYFVTPIPVGSNLTPTPRSIVTVRPASFSIANQVFSLNFVSGNLEGFNSSTLGSIPFTNQIMQYTESDNPNQSGGAYIFRTKEDKPAVPILTDTSNPSYYYEAIVGPYVQSFTQVYSYDVTINANHWQNPCAVLDLDKEVVSTNTTQIFRLYTIDGAQASAIEVEYAVGPVEGNRDVIARYETPNISGVVNANQFYQADNGLITMQRTFNDSQPLLIPGNYYPIVNSAYIEDTESDLRLTILTSHSHGGASLSPGQIEVVLHRRTLQDDSRGVSCPLDDITRLFYKQRVTLNSTTDSEQIRQRERLELNNPQTMFFGAAQSPSDWVSQYNSVFAPMQADLPLNVYLLSLQYYDGNNPKVILRLQHLFEAGSDPIYAVPVTIDINSIFSSLQFSNIEEVTISANQNYLECSAKRWQWNTASSSTSSSSSSSNVSHSPRAPASVTLQPGQIKTFSATLSA